MRIKSWRLKDRAGCVFAWFDEEEGEPTCELSPMPQAQEPLWLCSEVEEMGEWPVHQMELSEYGMDKIHLATCMARTGLPFTR